MHKMLWCMSYWNLKQKSLVLQHFHSFEPELLSGYKAELKTQIYSVHLVHYVNMLTLNHSL